METRLVSVDEAARLLSLAPRSLLDRRFRTRHGLHAVKIGRTLRFDLAELQALIRRSREPLPGEGGR